MNAEEPVYDARTTLLRGEVTNVNDGTPLQTVDVITHTGVTRAGVEVAQPWGFVSVPPDGAIALLAFVGGDPADAMAIAVTHAGARAGGSAKGTVGISDNGANRVLVKPGGLVEIAAATSVTVTVGGTVWQITPEGVFITGALTVSGPIHGTADNALHVS
jgi:phage gp45-like